MAQPFQDGDICVDSIDPGEVCWFRDVGGNWDDTDLTGGEWFKPDKNGTDITKGSGLLNFEAFPGETPTFVGQDSAALKPSAAEIELTCSYCRLEGMTVQWGWIKAGSGTGQDSMYDIVGNTVGPACRNAGNFGLIWISGGNVAPNADGLFLIRDNTVQDLMQNISGTCETWDNASDTEHLSGIMVHNQDSMTHASRTASHIINNTIRRTPSAYYWKINGYGPLYSDSNVIRDVQSGGELRSMRQRHRWNLYVDAGIGLNHDTTVLINTDPVTEDPFPRNDSIINNTVVRSGATDQCFSANFLGGPAGGDPQYGPIIKDNVCWLADFITNPTTPLGDWEDGADVNENCFVNAAADSSAWQYYHTRESWTWTQAIQQATLDAAGVFVSESAIGDVFTDTASEDYSLKGTAATSCAGKGRGF
jgi:hypothetical protein